ncbi:hypothetical protein [Gloeothece verrucosa]|uniref:Uncharacterized protein n=1 Tax=Gloeothece verrucosa (strain PCC 7822) TaxID=497965 RepID=E0U9D4_GLOV7|nr:hypothetical protein [Gloeothece verrucosa]ADN12626.1 conserved hypothetical protein [Gloeothece verrucosa PCC 7822]
MLKHLTWQLNAIGFLFTGIVLANPTQALLAKNAHDHDILLKSSLLDYQNRTRVSLIDKKNLKTENLAHLSETQSRRRNHEVSIQLANDIAYGLTIAQDKGDIKYGTTTYRKVQTAIHLLRRGAGLDGASRRSGVPRNLLDQLMQMGQKRPGALIDHVLD